MSAKLVRFQGGNRFLLACMSFRGTYNPSVQLLQTCVSYSISKLDALAGIYENQEKAINWDDGMWKDGSGNGLVITVEGRVPQGSGLSSSSALVCAASLAIAAKMGLKYSQTQIAEIARKCEQYIGTLSGGMDQVSQRKLCYERTQTLSFQYCYTRSGVLDYAMRPSRVPMRMKNNRCICKLAQ